MDMSGALAIIQGLLGLVMAIFAWYGQRQIARLDRHGDRIAKLESANEVFEIRLEAAATSDSIRSIIREELDRAMAPIMRDTEEMRSRIKDLENQKPFG
jgi:hypothetical protein